MQLKADPLELLTEVVHTTVGSFLLVVTALSLATHAGYFAVSGAGPDVSSVGQCVLLCFAFVWPIVLAVAHLWGVVYLAALAWVFHAIFFQDLPRVRLTGLIMLPQFLCTVSATGSFRHVEWGQPQATWLLVIGGGFLACAAPFLLFWRKSR